MQEFGGVTTWPMMCDDESIVVQNRQWQFGSRVAVCEQALHLVESREVTRYQHAKGEASAEWKGNESEAELIEDL